tara:strand:- start:1492 stop:2169 length:678 start_codon:yes stop_codon:yes gene_type:complete
MEGISLWLNPITTSTLSIQILTDSLNSPGSLVYEWPLVLFGTNLYQEYYISTVSDCVDLPENQYYWLSVKSVTENASIKWQYSLLNGYYSLSNDGGDSWDDITFGSLGATSIRAEQIFTYSPGIPDGDVNYDYSADVLDIVLTVAYVLGSEELSEEQQEIVDLNDDMSIDILDIVILVELVLEEPELMPDFSLIDINSNSEYYGEVIGPSFFSGQVSGYYFGKAG